MNVIETEAQLAETAVSPVIETPLPRERYLHGNLGCGKVIFPTPEMREAEPHVDWLNIDRLPLPGVEQQLDLFQYPWPLPDEYFDHLFCSHVVEHIPHQPRYSGWCSAETWKRYQDLDGFYAFFAECWRVLKPGGTILVVVPHAGSDGADQDPQHTRYLVPTTISYLCQQQSPTFDYHLGSYFHWQIVEVQFSIDTAFVGLPSEEVERLAHRQRNVIYEFRFTLRKLPLAGDNE